MDVESSGHKQPTEILGRQVTEVCPDCHGEGLLWEMDELETTHWAVRCERCNCVGFILDLPDNWRKQPQSDDDELDHDNIPF